MVGWLQRLARRVMGYSPGPPRNCDVGPPIGLTVKVGRAIWLGRFRYGKRTVELVLRGRKIPDSKTLDAAKQLVAEFDMFHRLLQQYLAACAATKQWSAYASELGAQAPLRVQMEVEPGAVTVFLTTVGKLRHLEEERAWYCIARHGRFMELGFDG